ncbi:MAG: GIN domain-containing protein [Crocinitomicaceae bacterium]
MYKSKMNSALSKTTTIFILSIGMLFFSCKKINASKGTSSWHSIEISESFHSIELSLAGNLNYQAGEEKTMEIYCNDKIYEDLDIEIKNEILQIKMKKGFTIKNGEEISINITAPDIHVFINSGSGNFNANTDPIDSFSSSNVTLSGSGNIFVDRLESYSNDAVLSGSGNLTINELIVTESDMTLSGSGKVNVAGSAMNNNTVLSGSGSILAKNFITDISDINISGSGNLEIHVDSLLNVNISGSGSVLYTGFPSINVTGSGSGSVTDNN